MVTFGQAQLSQVPERITLADFIHGCVERFSLLRPEAELDLQVDNAIVNTVLRIPPGLRHALLNLLNNAVDASALCESQIVQLYVRREAGWLELIVRDHGPGFTATGAPAVLGHTGKQSGLGLGLALTEATAERLNGELTTRNTNDGAEMCLRLPLKVITGA
jgi:two-component system sensor histidine kinase RegB